MFAVVLAVIAIAVVARLVSVVHHDRPLSPPRSHTHELDRDSARALRAF